MRVWHRPFSLTHLYKYSPPGHKGLGQPLGVEAIGDQTRPQLYFVRKRELGCLAGMDMKFAPVAEGFLVFIQTFSSFP